MPRSHDLLRRLVRESLLSSSTTAGDLEARLEVALVDALEARVLDVVNRLTSEVEERLGDTSGITKPRWEELEPTARRAASGALQDPRVVDAVLDVAMHAMMVRFA